MLTCAGATLPVAAQEPIHETVVVTAAATPVSLDSVTRALTVITREQLSRLPVSTVADVLRLAASVDVRARGERGVQSDFAVRGANFGQALVLVDGMRLNDPQTGHHNGDIPVPVDMIECIEILHGSGASLFGADAVGGTINVITRKDALPASAVIEAGSFGLVAGRGNVGFQHGTVRQVVSVDGSRSSGFMFDRDFKTLGVSSRLSFSEQTSVFAGYLWKDFGANGFYGNSPSRESTNQTLVGLDQRLGQWAGWSVVGNASYRTHGDWFLWDVRRPGVAENRHRTHVTIGSLKASTRVGPASSITAGLEGGGDWIRSNNLGARSTARVSAFGEWRQAIAAATYLDGSLRMDRYTEFGTAWSPSLGVGWWPSSPVRLRAAVGRAFRVPTFTERYYSDPAHLARSDLRPETAWAAELGIDVFGWQGWTMAATVFGRLEQDVIDWLRPSIADRWRTYNIRDVNTVGVELSAQRPLRAGAFVQASYTGLRVGAGAVTQLSKYVLDYSPHGVAVAAVLPIPGDVLLAPRAAYRRRTRSTGSSEYVLFDARLARRFGHYELRVEGTNLFNASYQEVLGVDMPGRAATVSIAVGVN